MCIRKTLAPILVTLVTIISAFIMFTFESNAATVNASSVAEIQQAINNASGALKLFLLEIWISAHRLMCQQVRTSL